MPVTEVCHHRVVIETGKKSHTVNICNEQGRPGVYDWIVRFRDTDLTLLDSAIQQNKAAQQSIPGFVLWLRSTLGGEVERVPPDEDPLLNANWPAATDPAPDFSQLVLPVVEAAIDRLIRDHLSSPSAHRSEHNVHSELYASLKQEQPFASKWPLSDGTTQVYLLQQEWPERLHTERLGSFDLKTLWPLSGRFVGPSLNQGRGRYDLAILSPSCVAQHTEAEFLDGTFPPVVAVEFGLIENYAHLRDDAAKLINNKLAHGYLVHLVQPGYTDNFDAVEVFLERLTQRSTVRSAYARVERRPNGVKYHYKLLGDGQVTHADRPP